MIKYSYCGKYKDRAELMLAVLDWVLQEHLSGRRPDDNDVAKQFDMPIQDAIDLHNELEDMGEFD
jgi:hypothetical protein